MEDNNKKIIAVIFAAAIMLTAVFVNSIVFTSKEAAVPKFIKTILKNSVNDKSNAESSKEIENTEGIFDKDAGSCSFGSDIKDGGFDAIFDGTNEDHCEVDQERSNSDSPTYASIGAMASGVVIEQTSRRVLFDENMHVRCYPASTTKILTALVVLQRLPLEMTITVPKEGAGVEGSSIYLRAGQRITVEDMLYGLMLRSGNDAAQTLAIATAGSVEAFAKMMNATAKECGALESNFVNPHGLHDDMHYTTAYDMALIAAKAYEYEDFRKIVNTKIARIAIDGESVAIGNKNKLLKQLDGANGVKTGYTKKSGRCLVGGAMQDGMQLISVVMDCPDMWNDTAVMLKSCFEKYEMVPIDEAIMRSGDKTVRIELGGTVTENWENIKYPLLKDGSERLEITN